ncbi:hypothetical protein V6N11_030886 [Hibiscus sabdariffa]|uniref:RNase H type-1 domain-containing protein n=1 Tax=Hibiscus sabdariffa TaxID=183260 RepID=A0ABR1ZRL6_9ROSI
MIDYEARRMQHGLDRDYEVMDDNDPYGCNFEVEIIEQSILICDEVVEVVPRIYSPMMLLVLVLMRLEAIFHEQGLPDRVLWTRTENGRFQVRSAYEGCCRRHKSIVQASLRLQQECTQGTGGAVNLSVAARNSSRQGVRWRKPPEKWWKLNSDGAVATSSGLSSCDSVIRVAVVVDLIRNYKSDETTFSLVSHIATLLNRSWQVEIKHVLREGNKLADSMAKLDCFDDFIFHHFLSSPELVYRWLEEEREGMPYDVG